MMRKMVMVASGLLVVQLALILVVHLGARNIGAVVPNSPFLSFSVDAVTSLELTDDKGTKLILQKKDDGWILPELYSAPANKDAIVALLKKLANLKQGVVAATTEQGAERFKVVEKGFEHHVVIKGGKQVLADFYVGTSPAFRQVNARKKDAKQVVNLELSGYELESGSEKWLSPALATVADEDLSRVEFKDVVLKKEKKGWRFEGLGQDEKPVQEKVDDLATRVRTFTVQRLLDPKKGAELTAKTAALHFTLGLKNGETLTYSFWKGDDKDSYVLKRSDRDLYMQVHKLPVESLQKLNRADLLEKAVEKTHPEKASSVQN